MIGILSLAHMLEDFLCGYTVFGYLVTFHHPAFVFLWYNFFAFAMQLPLGSLIDVWMQKTDRKLQPGIIFSLGGLILTLLHVQSSLAVYLLGMGNCLFHVGGGVITIKEDDRNSYHGKGLGVFVAPGAIGLYAGALISYFFIRSAALPILLITAVLCLRCIHLYRSCPDPELLENTDAEIPLIPILVCFAFFTGISMSDATIVLTSSLVTAE